MLPAFGLAAAAKQLLSIWPACVWCRQVLQEACLHLFVGCRVCLPWYGAAVFAAMGRHTHLLPPPQAAADD